MQSVHLQLSEELLARVDAERGLIARNAWIRWAVERALVERPYRQTVPGPNVENVRSSSQAKRGVQSRPKGGKK